MRGRRYFFADDNPRAEASGRWPRDFGSIVIARLTKATDVAAAGIAAPLAWLAAKLKLPVLCLGAALVAMLLTRGGLLAHVEAAVGDAARFSVTSSPSSSLLLIVADEESVRKYGKYPYDRAILAKALDILAADGASRIYVDAALSAPEDQAGDQALAEALGRLGPSRVALPVATPIDGDDKFKPARPLDMFASNATLANTKMDFDGDLRVRRIEPSRDSRYVLTSAWIAGRERTIAAGPLSLDYEVDPREFARARLVDLVEGRVDASTIRGKPVAIGLILDAAQQRVATPLHFPVSRLELLALGAETIWKGDSPRESPPWLAFVVCLAAAVGAAIIVRPTSPLVGLVIIGGVSATWLLRVRGLELTGGWSLPVTSPMIAALVVWQVLRSHETAIVRWARQRYRDYLGASQVALAAAADIIGDPAIVFDRAGKMLAANGAWRTALVEAGIDPATPAIADVAPAASAEFLRAFGAIGVHHCEVSIGREGRPAKTFMTSIRCVASASGPLAIATLKDVTHDRRVQAELRKLAYHDGLTGLYNRLAFQTRLKSRSNAVGDAPFSVLQIDLDGFKKVNDTLGHHAGDLLLQGVAARLRELLGPDDVAARLGGDEFAIILATGDREKAANFARAVIAALLRPFEIEGDLARIGGSIGVAVWPDDDADAGEALKKADAAMYRAKQVKPAIAVHADPEPYLIPLQREKTSEAA